MHMDLDLMNTSNNIQASNPRLINLKSFELELIPICKSESANVIFNN